MTSAIHATSSQISFEEEARQILLKIRRAFVAILDQTCGPMRRSTDIAAALSISRKLAWQIGKFAYITDSFVAARFIPSGENMKTFLTAAGKRGVTERLLQTTEEAVSDFEKLIHVHAGDRQSLEMMLLGCSAQADDATEVALRRSAFLSNALTWGVQAKTWLVANIVAPGSEDDRLDMVRIRGYTGFRRNRPNLSWVVSHLRFAADNWKKLLPEAPEPIDDISGVTVPLLRDFCSRPLPEFRRRTAGQGFLVDELAPGRVGNTGAVTFFTGEISRNTATRFRDGENTFNEFAARVRTPMEVLLFDLFIYDHMFDAIEPRAFVYSELAGPSARDEEDRLPNVPRVAHLGRGLDVIQSPEVPRYADMAQHVFDRLSWNESKFDVYRVRIEYPAMPVAVTITHPLPDRPG